MKRLASAATCAVTIASTALALAPSSSAATVRCTLESPTRVSIGQPTQNIVLRAQGGCLSGEGNGSWNLNHTSGAGHWSSTREIITFSQNYPTNTWVVPANHELGVMRWTKVSSYDGAGHPAAQNEPFVDIRLKGGATVQAVRHGATVTLTGTSSAYSATAKALAPRTGTTGVFQYRDATTKGAWKSLKQVTTSGTKATARWSYTHSGSREYRFATYSTATVWSAASASTTR